MLGVALAPSDARGMSKLRITIALLAGGAFLLSVAQYFDFLGLNLSMARIYAPESLVFGNLDQLLAGASNRRVSGTLGNPNWWGWWILTLAIFTYCWGSSGRISRVVPLLAALSVALLLTGSRTSLVSLLVGLGAATAAMSSRRAGGQRSTRKAAGAVVLLVMLGSGWFAMQTLYEAQERFSVRRLDSLFERFRVWERGAEVFAEHPILGTGPRKGDLLRDSPDARRVSFVDNAYLAVLARFGMVGLTLYLGFLALVSIRTLHAARAAPEALRWWPTAMFGAWAACAVFGFAADTIFAVQPMVLLSLFHGISIGVGAARPRLGSSAVGGRLERFPASLPGGQR
jgi:O-antigen ligase